MHVIKENVRIKQESETNKNNLNIYQRGSLYIVQLHAEEYNLMLWKKERRCFQNLNDAKKRRFPLCLSHLVLRDIHILIQLNYIIPPNNSRQYRELYLTQCID